MPKKKEKKEVNEQVKKEVTIGDKDVESMKYVVGFSGESAGVKDLWLEKLDRFLNLPESERDKRCRWFVDYIINLSKQKGGAVAGRAFIKLLNTPEGMIHFTYMFRPEFRALIVRAIASLITSISKVK